MTKSNTPTSSREKRNIAHDLAIKMAHRIGNVRCPSTDSCIYEPWVPAKRRAYQKKEAQVARQLDRIILKIEALSKMTNKFV